MLPPFFLSPPGGAASFFSIAADGELTLRALRKEEEKTKISPCH